MQPSPRKCKLSGCLAERSKAPDSSWKSLLGLQTQEISGIVRCKSSNLLATIFFKLEDFKHNDRRNK